MQVIKSKNSKFPKVRLTKAEVAKVRKALNCTHRPIQYAGGIMYWHGAGWYEVSTNPTELDWASDEQMMNALIRKIRKVVNEQTATAIDYSKPNVGKKFIDVGLPIYVTQKAQPIEYVKAPTVDTNRLEALQRRINGKYHHG